MQLPQVLRQNIQALYGQQGELWLQQLPTLLPKLCEKWGLRFLGVMPNLSYFLILEMQMLDTKETVIVKMAPNGEQLAQEAVCLQCLGPAAANVFWFDSQYHALCMERLQPGIPLKSMVLENDDAATRIIAQMMLALQNQQTFHSGFKHLSHLASDLQILEGMLEKPLLSKAQELFKALTTDHSSDILLHGDLHHDNILSCGNSWKVIDPHGYIGDPAFAVGAMIYNPRDYVAQQDLTPLFTRRLAILAEELPYDPQRINAWAFCMGVLSLAWTLQDHQHMPAFDLSVAQTLASII